MPKKDNIQIFIDEIYSKSLKENTETNKRNYNHIDEIWSIDLVEFSDFKTTNKRGYRYILVVVDNSSKNIWCIPLEKKFGETIKNEFSNVLTTSKRSPLKIESDRGAEF